VIPLSERSGEFRQSLLGEQDDDENEWWRCEYVLGAIDIVRKTVGSDDARAAVDAVRDEILTVPIASVPSPAVGLTVEDRIKATMPKIADRAARLFYASPGRNIDANTGAPAVPFWPFEPAAWKPEWSGGAPGPDAQPNVIEQRIEDLVKAGALVWAEIDRLDRLSAVSGGPDRKGGTDGQ
jgi:hypothetical protein